MLVLKDSSEAKGDRRLMKKLCNITSVHIFSALSESSSCLHSGNIDCQESSFIITAKSQNYKDVLTAGPFMYRMESCLIMKKTSVNGLQDVFLETDGSLFIQCSSEKDNLI